MVRQHIQEQLFIKKQNNQVYLIFSTLANVAELLCDPTFSFSVCVYLSDTRSNLRWDSWIIHAYYQKYHHHFVDLTWMCGSRQTVRLTVHRSHLSLSVLLWGHHSISLRLCLPSKTLQQQLHLIPPSCQSRTTSSGPMKSAHTQAGVCGRKQTTLFKQQDETVREANKITTLTVFK